MNVMKTWKRRLLSGGLLFAVLLLGIMSGLLFFRKTPEEAAVPVYSAEALRDRQWSSSEAVEAQAVSGTVKSYYQTQDRPVAEVYVSAGQSVAAGEALLRYDSSALQAERDQTELTRKNEEIYLGRLAAYILTLKQTRPVMDGLGRGMDQNLFTVSYETETRQETDPETDLKNDQEENQKNDHEAIRGQEEAPVVYERITADSLPFQGTGTAEDPCSYYLKRGGEVEAAVLVSLMRLEKCGRFVIVENEEMLDTPLFVWNFDGKAYEEAVKGETDPAGPGESTEPEKPGETDPSQSGEETEPTKPEETNQSQSGEEMEPTKPEETEPSQSGEETEPTKSEETDPSQSEEETLPQPEEPDFDGIFGEEQLEDALNGLEEPKGYTKEELAKLLSDRLLEYEKLELAIRKKEASLKALDKEIAACTVTAAQAGTASEVRTPEEAARFGQPVLTFQGAEGVHIEGLLGESLFGSVSGGEAMTILLERDGKQVSLEAELSAVSREPEETESSSGNPAMSRYRFRASASKQVLRAGESVRVLFPSGEEGQGMLVLPASMIFYEHGQACAYVMGADGRLEKREVETGRTILGTKLEICSGLEETDYLAEPGADGVRAGAKAQIVYGKEMEIGPEETTETAEPLTEEAETAEQKQSVSMLKTPEHA